MIDQEIRSHGVGGSEVAAICGLDPRRDAFAVYADKLGLIERPKPTARMKWGRRIERVIADAYGEETGRVVCWDDVTRSNPSRPWQVMTADALVWCQGPGPSWIGPNVEGGLDCKNVSWDQAPKWGEAGTDLVPDWTALQMQWYCFTAGLPWWDVAALFGGNDLRVYRIHGDAEIHATLHDVVSRFWHGHVVARVPPPIGCSQAARDYLKRRFPQNTQSLRSATVDELGLLARLKQAKEEFEECEAEKESLENAIKEAIGNSDGLTWPPKGKVTWLKNKDTMGADWEAVARVGLQEEDLVRLIPQHQIITRHGPRVLRCSWPKDNFWIEGLPPAA